MIARKQIAKLRNDLELLRVIENEMRFIPAPELIGDHVKMLNLIQYFHTAYESTDQDTVLFGPEFVVVVRRILEGFRPVKLRYLTDFEGEEK